MQVHILKVDQTGKMERPVALQRRARNVPYLGASPIFPGARPVESRCLTWYYDRTIPSKDKR